MTKTELQNNNADLRNIINSLSNLPTVEDVSAELTEQDLIIEQIALALDSKAAAELFAAIGVIYPAGSTCTCTNGVETLTAKNTSGQCVFPIPEVGTWTVSCTNGDKSKSETVEITAEGQNVSVGLSYRFYLFQTGVGSNIPLTTGGGSFASIKITTDNIHFDIGGYNSAAKIPYLYADEPVDVTNYSKLIIEGTSSGGNLGLTFGLSSSKGGSLAVSDKSTGAFTSLTIDISSLTGNYYFVHPETQIYVTERDVYITNIYFE